MVVPSESAGPRAIPEVMRLVVKVGSSSLADASGSISRPRLAKVVRDVAQATDGGRRCCALVSSGAIASGLAVLGLRRRPKRLAGLQAAAAVGQGRLLSDYIRLFDRRGIVAAQVLVTQDDFIRRRHFVNAQNTFEQLFAVGAVPVVNENDTVATEEITFGDNDRLAALVAIIVKADLLVLLSDVDGIYTRDPRQPGARLVPTMTAGLEVEVTAGPGSPIGSGGMRSKLDAAGLATAAGIPTVVANAARKDVLARILGGEPVGTFLPARGRLPRARKAWVAFAATPRGRIRVDVGAERAVRDAGRSLLAAGVVGVAGAFAAGDIVEVLGPEGRAFARGVASYSSEELPRLAGRSSRSRRGATVTEVDPSEPERDVEDSWSEVIHRDELVVTGEGEWPA
jgi:glutamate 5-kinase